MVSLSGGNSEKINLYDKNELLYLLCPGADSIRPLQTLLKLNGDHNRKKKSIFGLSVKELDLISKSDGLDVNQFGF
jgi:hypothetical protein